MWPFDPIHDFLDPYISRFDDFFSWIEALPLVELYAPDYFWYPLIETTHVLFVAVMVGSIMFVDLRLLGLISRGNSVRRASKILPYTWWAFLIAVISGLLLYAPQATRAAHNEAFQIKMFLILAAGINMAAFHFGVWRRVDAWDEGVGTPLAAKIAGVLSLVFWLGAVFYGRFTPFVV